MEVMPYDRQAAVRYAHEWAFGRSPRYLDFSELGGDCTNYASQCVLAGAGIMNYTKTFGWYYRSSSDRTPSWTGVEYFHRFMVGNKTGPGPFMEQVGLDALEIGDIVQLRFAGMERFSHCPIVVGIGARPAPDNILVAAHTYDSDNRPLSTYTYAELRPLHVLGVRR